MEGSIEVPGRITVRDKVLLLLHDSRVQPDLYIVPESVTQSGMSDKLGIRQNNLSRALRDLESEDLVGHRSARIRNRDRRKRAYYLTRKGMRSAEELQSSILRSTGVARITSSDVVKWPVRRILQRFKTVGGGKLSDLLIDNYDGRIFDLVSLYRSPDEVYPRPDIERFYGRERELSDLEEAFEDPAVRMISVIGIAGQGKTTLVSRFQEIRPDNRAMWFGAGPWLYPENILEGASENLALMGYDRLLSSLTSSGGNRLRDLTLLLIEGMERSSSALIMEDLHTANRELLNFLKKILDYSRKRRSGIKIVITSRERPEIYTSADLTMNRGIRELHLKGLSPEAVKNMVEDLALPNVDPEKLYRVTKGHPLALELVVGSGGDPGDVEGEIEDYIDGEILSDLPSRQQDIVKLISLIDEPVREALLLEIEGVKHEDIMFLLNRLVLRRYPDGSLDVHDLIGEIVSGRISDSEVESFVALVRDHHRRSSDIGSEMAVIRLLRRTGRKDELVDEILENGEPLLDMGYRSVMDIASSLDKKGVDPERSTRLELLLAEGYVGSGDLSEARRHLARAAVHCTGSLNSGRTKRRMSLAVDILSRYQRLSVLSGDNKGTVTGLREGLRFLERIGGGRGDARILIRLSETMMRMGKTKAALAHLDRAGNLVGEDDHWEHSRIRMLRGMIYQRNNRLSSALEEFLRLEKMARERGLVDMRVRSLYSTGNLYRMVGEDEEAFHYLEDSLRLAVREGDHEMVGRIIDSSADLFADPGSMGPRSLERARKRVRSNRFARKAKSRGATTDDVSLLSLRMELYSCAVKGSECSAWIKRLLKNALESLDQRSYLDIVERTGRTLFSLDERAGQDFFRIACAKGRVFNNPRLDSILLIMWGRFSGSKKQMSRGKAIARSCGFPKAVKKADELLKRM